MKSDARSEPRAPLYDVSRTIVFVNWYCRSKLYCINIGLRALSKLCVRNEEAIGFCGVNELNEVPAGSATIGVLIVNGGETVCAADTLGREIVGIFGALSENCDICWF